MKNLYLVKRTDEVGYEEYDSMVVAASSEDEARTTHPDGRWDEEWAGWSWVFISDIESLSVELIGTAKDGLDGLILASFNAG